VERPLWSRTRITTQRKHFSWST